MNSLNTAVQPLLQCSGCPTSNQCKRWAALLQSQQVLNKMPLQFLRTSFPPKQSRAQRSPLCLLWGNVFGTHEQSPPPPGAAQQRYWGCPSPAPTRPGCIGWRRKGGMSPQWWHGEGEAPCPRGSSADTSSRGTLRGAPSRARSTSLSSSVQPYPGPICMSVCPWHGTVPLRSPPRGSGSPARPGADVPSTPSRHGRDRSEPGGWDSPGNSSTLPCPCSP